MDSRQIALQSQFAFVLDDPFSWHCSQGWSQFSNSIRQDLDFDLDFMITKSLLDVSEITPTITSTAPSLRFAILRTAARVCDLSFFRPIKRVEHFSVALTSCILMFFSKGNTLGPAKMFEQFRLNTNSWHYRGQFPLGLRNMSLLSVMISFCDWMLVFV